MSQLSQISGWKEKKTGIIHKQSLTRDDTRNLTFCDYYCFCRKFCFVLALKSDEMVNSLCSGKVCIWRENFIFMRVPRGRIQKIQIAVAGELASYLDYFYFATVIEKIIQKSTNGPLGHPLNPRMVPRWGSTILSSRWLFDGIQHLIHVYFQSRIWTQFFFPFHAPQCSPF